MSAIYCPTDITDQFTAILFVDTFKVQAFTMTPDGSGGSAQTWADTSTGIPGMLEESHWRSLETTMAAAQQAQRRWAITLKNGTVVDEAMRIIQTHQRGIAITPRTFKVLAVVEGETFNYDVSCECVELPNLS